MKTNVLILTLSTVFLFSCSSDDGSSGTQTAIEDQYLNKITKQDGSDHVLINYNPDRTIHEIRHKVEDAFWLSIQYEYNTDDQIRAMYLTGEGISTYYFSYDEDGNLSAYRFDEIEMPVEYDPAENSYEYYDGDDLCKAFLNEHGDIVKFSITPFAHEEETYNFTYDQSKLGALHNANPVTLHTLIATNERFFMDSFISNNLSSRPFEACQGEALTITSENSFDPNGFLKKASMTNTSTQTIKALSYEYIEL